MERAEDCTDVPFAHASFEGALVEGRKSWGNLDIFHEAGCHVLGIFFTVPDASERLDRVDLASACSVGVQDGDAEDAVGLRANVECIAVHLHAIIWDQAHDEAAFAQCAEALVRVVLRAHLKCGWFIIGRFGAAVRSPFLVERIDFFTGVFAVLVVDFMCASAIFHVGAESQGTRTFEHGFHGFVRDGVLLGHDVDGGEHNAGLVFLSLELNGFGALSVQRCCHAGTREGQRWGQARRCSCLRFLARPTTPKSNQGTRRRSGW